MKESKNEIKKGESEEKAMGTLGSSRENVGRKQRESRKNVGRK